jgi:hypothetical protein
VGSSSPRKGEDGGGGSKFDVYGGSPVVGGEQEVKGVKGRCLGRGGLHAEERNGEKGLSGARRFLKGGGDVE